jgi:hypothetical protein
MANQRKRKVRDSKSNKESKERENLGKRDDDYGYAT